MSQAGGKKKGAAKPDQRKFKLRVGKKVYDIYHHLNSGQICGAKTFWSVKMWLYILAIIRFFIDFICSLPYKKWKLMQHDSGLRIHFKEMGLPTSRE